METNQEHLFRNEATTPESLLWVTVIVFAIHDARVDFDDVTIVDAPNKTQGPKFRVLDQDGFAISQTRLRAFYNCLIARLWFEQQQDEYKLVCSLAGLDDQYVYKVYQGVLKDDNIDPTVMLKQYMKY